MLNSAFLYSFQSNKETENQMFKIGLGRIGCLQLVDSVHCRVKRFHRALAVGRGAASSGSSITPHTGSW